MPGSGPGAEGFLSLASKKAEQLVLPDVRIPASDQPGIGVLSGTGRSVVTKSAFT